MNNTTKAIFSLAALIAVPTTIILKGTDVINDINNANVKALSGEINTENTTPISKAPQDQSENPYGLKNYIEPKNEPL